MLPRNESGKQGPSAGGGAMKSLSESIASQVTRRSALVRFAAGTAAVFGVKFGLPTIVDTFTYMQSAEASPEPGPAILPRLRKRGTCTFTPHAVPCTGSMIQCGMSHGKDCDSYRLNDTGGNSKCSGCWDATFG